MTKPTLYQLFQTTIPFAHKDKDSYSVHGVRLEVEGSRIKAIATNKHILIVFEAEFDNVNNIEQGSYTVEYESVKTLMALLKENPAYQILQNDFKKIDGDYVDYARVSNSTAPTTHSIEEIRIEPQYLKVICNACIQIQKIDHKASLPVFAFVSAVKPIKCKVVANGFNVTMIVAPVMS